MVADRSYSRCSDLPLVLSVAVRFKLKFSYWLNAVFWGNGHRGLKVSARDIIRSYLNSCQRFGCTCLYFGFEG